jgi:hypothetical protein
MRGDPFWAYPVTGEADATGRLRGRTGTQTNALKPVIAFPTMSEFIWRVPSKV